MSVHSKYLLYEISCIKRYILWNVLYLTWELPVKSLLLPYNKKLHDAQIFALVILNLQSCRSVSFWSKSTSGSGYAHLFWIRIWAKIYFFLHFLLKIMPLKTIIFMYELIIHVNVVWFLCEFPTLFLLPRSVSRYVSWSGSRSRWRSTKMKQFQADPDPQHCSKVTGALWGLQTKYCMATMTVTPIILLLVNGPCQS